MHLCEKCLQAVVPSLKLEEMAALVYVLVAQKEASGKGQKFRGLQGGKIRNIFRTDYAAKTTLLFLVRIGLLARRKEDHSYLYSASREGQKAGSMILADETMKAKVNAFFVIGKEG